MGLLIISSIVGLSGILYFVYHMMRPTSQNSDNALSSQDISVVAKPQMFDNPNKLNPYS